METVIHEALGHVFHFDAGTLLPFTQVEDAFVGHTAVFAFVENGKMRLEALGHVVGIENGNFGRMLESRCAHHANIHPRNRQNARAAPRGLGDLADRLSAAGLDDAVSGQEGREVRGNADRTHARTAAAVRDAEGFVEIEMADVRADVPGTAEADLRVQVGSVHVDLPASDVHHVADFADAFFEDAVSGRICDHERGEFGAVLVDFFAEVRHVDIALRVTTNRHNGHAGHDRAGGVGAVCR